MKRREILKQATLASAAAYLTPNWKNQVKSKMTPAAVKPFTFCLNTSTIRGQKQGFLKDLETASAAGYDGVEIWINALQEYSESGRSLSDLKKKIEDWNLQVEDAIGFAQWIVDDKSTRDKAIEQLKNEMDLLAQIGCKRIAAPPAGATNEPGLDLDAAAERYATILDLGKQFGVMPQLEVWGFSKNLYKISQVLYVAAESGHPDAHILPDV
ncbi:MAG: sugar phosphate isomerase/epimerase, partial [Saprospiraceae bacterium]|nr:sugar phosphate isomerase/epimerase [Saprospiraceae bacterium]